MKIAPLSTLKADPNNLNLHTEAGHTVVERSISKRGVARPGFAAKDGTVLGGNLSSLEIPGQLGMQEVILIETDGTRPIVHVRTDLDPNSEEAKLLALEDNEASAVSYRRDVVALAQLAAQSDEVTDILPDDVVEKMLGRLVHEDATGSGDGNAPAPDYVRFVFGDYSGLVSREVYDSFAGRAQSMKGGAEVVMLDDILINWLKIKVKDGKDSR